MYFFKNRSHGQSSPLCVPGPPAQVTYIPTGGDLTPRHLTKPSNAPRFHGDGSVQAMDLFSLWFIFLT